MKVKIKYFLGKKGYGFITAEDKDYFFMQTDFIERKDGFCKVGREVSFFPTKNDRGLRATQIVAG